MSQLEKITHALNSMINDQYILKIDPYNYGKTLSNDEFSSVITHPDLNEPLYYDFIEGDNDTSFFISIGTELSLLKIFDVFNFEFDILKNIQKYCHDLNFINYYFYGKDLKEFVVPKTLKDCVYDYYYDGPHFSFASSDSLKFGISIEFSLDLNESIIIPELNIYYQVDNLKLPVCRSFKDYDDFKKILLKNITDYYLGLDINALKLNDHKILHMMHIQ